MTLMNELINLGNMECIQTCYIEIYNILFIKAFNWKCRNIDQWQNTCPRYKRRCVQSSGLKYVNISKFPGYPLNSEFHLFYCIYIFFNVRKKFINSFTGNIKR